MDAAIPGHAPESQPAAKDSAAKHSGAKDSVTTGKTLLFGFLAILGAFGCPPLGLVFAYSCLREPKRSRRWSVFARVVAGVAVLSVIVYALVFAAGRLPLTGWVITD